MSRGETVNLPDRENRSDSDRKMRGYGWWWKAAWWVFVIDMLEFVSLDFGKFMEIPFRSPRDVQNSGQTSPQLAIMPLIDLVDHHLPIPESLGWGKLRMWKKQTDELTWIEMGFPKCSKFKGIRMFEDRVETSHVSCVPIFHIFSTFSVIARIRQAAFVLHGWFAEVSGAFLGCSNILADFKKVTATIGHWCIKLPPWHTNIIDVCFCRLNVTWFESWAWQTYVTKGLVTFLDKAEVNKNHWIEPFIIWHWKIDHDGRNAANQLIWSIHHFFNTVLYIPGDAGFLPSTVFCFDPKLSSRAMLCMLMFSKDSNLWFFARRTGKWVLDEHLLCLTAQTCVGMV